MIKKNGWGLLECEESDRKEENIRYKMDKKYER